MDRIRGLSHLVYLSFIPLFCGLIYTQLFQYYRYQRLSELNSIRIIDLGIPRGTIFDRNGKVLVEDRPCLDLCFVPFDLKNPQKASSILGPVINIPQEKIESIFRKDYPNPFAQQFLKRDVNEREIAFVEEKSEQLSGIFIQVGLKRDYKLGEEAAHLLGYLGEVSPEELEEKKLKGEMIKAGDFVGKEGVEKVFDLLLKGKGGVSG